MSSAAACLLLCFGALFPADEATADRPWSIERDGANVTVRVPGEEGVVAWSDVAAALSDVAGFDGEVLQDALPLGEVDLRSGRTRLSLRALNLVLPDGVDVCAERGEEHRWGLRIDIDLEEFDESTRDIRRRARELIADTVDSGQPREHGLSWHDGPTGNATPSRVVILIHGYTSSAVAMHPLAEALAGEGYQCGFLEYPNDGPLVAAGEFISRTLRNDETLSSLLAADEARSITIITHSMGGLAARWMVEHPELRPEGVDQLIMIAPPSQGSNIAYLPGALDVFEHWLTLGEVDLTTFIDRSFADGLEEAHDDLRPASRFLRDLNACPRCDDIHYTIVLGDAGIVTRDELVRLEVAWNVLCEQSRLARFASPRIDSILADPEELLAGKGDGLVALSRGRLEGVDDVVVLPMHHGTLSYQLDSDAGRRLVDTIVKRLSADQLHE